MALEPYTKITVFSGLTNYYETLQFNNKKPKYNFGSGLMCGMMLSNIAMIKGHWEGCSGKPSDVTNKLIESLLLSIRDTAFYLVERYNWKKEDLVNIETEFIRSI